MRCKVITCRSAMEYPSLGERLTAAIDKWLDENDVDVLSITTRFHSDCGTATITYRPLVLSTTNSPIGSHHWFHTLLAPVLHIGEFLELHPRPTDDMLKEWGKTVFENCKELRDGFKSINQ